jgi:hypothetical protein
MFIVPSDFVGSTFGCRPSWAMARTAVLAQTPHDLCGARITMMRARVRVGMLCSVVKESLCFVKTDSLRACKKTITGSNA